MNHYSLVSSASHYYRQKISLFIIGRYIISDFVYILTRCIHIIYTVNMYIMHLIVIVIINRAVLPTARTVGSRNILDLLRESKLSLDHPDITR